MFFSGIKLNYKNRSIVKTYDSFRKAYIGILFYIVRTIQYRCKEYENYEMLVKKYDQYRP